MLRGVLQVVVLVAFASVGFAAVRLVRGPAQQNAAVRVGAALVLPGQRVAVLGDDSGALAAQGRIAVGPNGHVVHVRPAVAVQWQTQGPFDQVVLAEMPGDPTPLLAQVRAALRPGGRLVVLPQSQHLEFQVGAVFAEVYHRALRSTGDPGEVALRAALDKRLRPKTRQDLAQWRVGPASASLQEALGVDLARVLGDRTLVAELNDALAARGSGIAQALVARLAVADARLLQWLVLTYDDDGLLEPAGPALDPRQTRVLRTIHRLILAPLLGPLLTAGHPLHGDPAALRARIEHAGFRRVDDAKTDDAWTFAAQDPP